MATKHSREHLNPLKKKFISPNGNRKSAKFANISPKFKTNLKDFHKFSQYKKDASLKKKLYEMKKGKGEKYHLGGNSSDPLNLNSLIDCDPMLSTPQASPVLPMHGDSPIEIYHPHDHKDPLNLKCYPADHLKEGVTPKKKKKKKNKGGHNDIENKEEKNQNQESGKVEQTKEKKKKKKNKKTKSNATADDTSEKVDDCELEKLPEAACTTEIEAGRKSETDESSDSEPPRKKVRSIDEISQDEKCTENQPKECKESESKEVAETQTEQESESSRPVSKKTSDYKQKKHEKRMNKIFIYGNYNRYYNYRNAHCVEDLRLKSFSKNWFQGKDVLDIGCNVGDITIAVAQRYEPRIIIGNDIDNALIKIAKSKCQVFAQHSRSVSSGVGKNFPMSFAVTNGPIVAPTLLQNEDHLKFPKNIIFKQENYVPPDEKSLYNQRPMFDTVLCLSVTKWVHLNWGDEGLKRMFKKIYKNLRPGGRLILEPQPFVSYKKRRKLSEKIKSNYDNIRFKPEQFIDYLLSDEVGFVAYEVLEEPQHGAPGFRRPMYLFTKANTTTS